MYERNRNLVRRHDGRLVNVARSRGQLFVCSENCCCGRTEDGFAPVPVSLYHGEWERRRLRNIVHLTIGGCLGPCALANVALLLFDGRALWFHSMNSEPLVLALYDYIEQMLGADGYLPPPPPLADRHFTASAWQPRPDGQPVDDRRLWDSRQSADGSRPPPPPPPPRSGGGEYSVTELPLPHEVARSECDGGGGGRGPRLPAAHLPPRRNGELVFAAPWEGRAFGMAVALHEQQLYPWDEFRERLIAAISAADQREDQSGYYARWLAAFESLLAEKGIVTRDELDERTFEFEFGERDDVY